MAKYSKPVQTALFMFILFQTAPIVIAQESAPAFSFNTSVAVIGSGKADLGKGNKLQWNRSNLDAALTRNSNPRTSFGAEVSLGRTHYDFDADVLSRRKLDVDEVSLSLPVNMPFMERGGF